MKFSSQKIFMIIFGGNSCRVSRVFFSEKKRKNASTLKPFQSMNFTLNLFPLVYQTVLCHIPYPLTLREVSVLVVFTDNHQ